MIWHDMTRCYIISYRVILSLRVLFVYEYLALRAARLAELGPGPCSKARQTGQAAWQTGQGGPAGLAGLAGPAGPAGLAGPAPAGRPRPAAGGLRAMSDDDGDLPVAGRRSDASMAAAGGRE